MIFNSKKHPKFKEVMASKSSSRIKILIGGAFMSFAIIFGQSSIELTIVFALLSAGMFYWDIDGQTKSGIKMEQKINDLEEKIKELENNNSKSNNP